MNYQVLSFDHCYKRSFNIKALSNKSEYKTKALIGLSQCNCNLYNQCKDFPKSIDTMANLQLKFNSIVSLINWNLSWIGLSLNPESRPSRINTCAIVIGSALYMLFLVHSISESRHLETTSEMMFHIPWMLQYNLKAGNMYLQYDLVRDFLRWTKKSFSEVHHTPMVCAILKENNFKGLRMANLICGWENSFCRITSVFLPKTKTFSVFPFQCI